MKDENIGRPIRLEILRPVDRSGHERKYEPTGEYIYASFCAWATIGQTPGVIVEIEVTGVLQYWVINGQVSFYNK